MNYNCSPTTTPGEHSFYTADGYFVNGSQGTQINMSQYTTHPSYAQPDRRERRATASIPISPSTIPSFTYNPSTSFPPSETDIPSPQHTRSETTTPRRRSTSIAGEIEVNIDELVELRHSHSNASSDSNQTLTPAQRRRKAQNRAAQRALRDRKRQRVQELQEQVTNLTIKSSALETDNLWLKQQLVHTQMENQALKLGGFSPTQTRSDSVMHNPATKTPTDTQAPCWPNQNGSYVDASAGLPSGFQPSENNFEAAGWPLTRPVDRHQHNGWIDRDNSMAQVFIDTSAPQTSPPTVMLAPPNLAPPNLAELSNPAGYVDHNLQQNQWVYKCG